MTIVNHECYVSLEVAKLLKKVGFDWECRCYYETSGKLRGKNNGSFYNYNSPLIWQNNGNTDSQLYSTPTLTVAQSWLREVKECAVIVETHNVQAACVSAYVYCIYPIDATHPCEHINGFAEDQCFDTYEVAQEAGIKKALELILEKGE